MDGSNVLAASRLTGKREHRGYRGAKQRDRQGFAKRDQIGRQRGARIGGSSSA